MEETGLVFRPFVDPWVIGLAGLCVLAFVLVAYARTTRPVSRSLKRSLLVLHLAAAGAVLLALLRPTVQKTTHELVKRPLLLLIDQSRSMSQITDTPTGVSRLQYVNSVLADHADELDELKARYDVVTLGFARGLLSDPSAPDETASRYSAYGLALQQAFAEAAGGRADAAIVIGDGTHNLGPPDPVEVAAGLDAQGVPVLTVGVGKDHATSGLRDVKILDIRVPRSAYLFTSFPVRPEVLFRGCEGIPVEIRMDFPDQETQQQTIVPAHNEEIVPLEFAVVPERLGEFRIRVNAVPAPNEVLDTNNAATAYVKVVSEGVRVGFFDSVRPESKFTTRSLAGAEHVHLRRVLVLRGQRVPLDESDAERYDVLILGDLDSGAVQPSRLLQIRKAVEEDGKGLIFLMGQREGARLAWRDTAVEDLLPVVVPSSMRALPGARQLTVAPDHAEHAVFALDDGTRRATVDWSDLPPLAGAAGGVRPKRGATVLASDDQGEPLLAVQRVGSGRVACLMADTTFRWFFTERDTQDLHRRFWRQLVLWVSGREEEERGPLRVDADRQHVLTGEKVQITATLRNADGTSVRDAELKLVLTDPTDRPVVLPYTFSREKAAFVAEYVPQIGGDYMVTAEAPGEDGEREIDTTHFHANATDRELEDPIADLKLLRRMAAATREYGGRYYPADRFGDLLNDLRSDTEPLKLTTRRRRDIWDAWPLFAVFAVCMATEWVIRRSKGLM
jgi:uncharacterized membrane protein